MASNSNFIGGGVFGGGIARAHTVVVTPRGSGVAVGRSQGEGIPAGTVFSAYLNERPNLSNGRNLGPSGDPSPVLGAGLPVVTMNMRSTGRLALQGPWGRGF